MRQAVRLGLDEMVLNLIQAQQRAAEVLLVCTRADSGEVAGIATTKLDTAAALGMPIWQFGIVVAGRWRRNNIAFQLLNAALHHHAGHDRRPLINNNAPTKTTQHPCAFRHRPVSWYAMLWRF